MTVADAAGPTESDAALFDRARAWLYAEGASGWVADAFGHWVIAEVAPHQRVPEPLSGLWLPWSYDPVPARYRARHGARLHGSPPWLLGDPLPNPPSAAGPAAITTPT